MKEEVKIVLPKLGESILSATVVRWFKKEGDSILLDEPLLEVSTDKVNSEIPSPVAGILKVIHAVVDQELQVGDLLATIHSAGTLGSVPVPPKHVGSPTTSSCGMKDFFSPGVLRLAQELGISLEQLAKISGTGEGGRVTKQDVEQWKNTPVLESTDPIERVKMSGMRKAIAENMVRSFYEAPHATLVAEVDITKILKLIQREKETFAHSHGCKLTITSFIAKAVVQALQEFPLINSSLEGDTILLKKFINLGIAVSIEQGLVVPVIKNCQKLGIVSLAQAIQEITQKARSSKLSMEDLSEGSISLTNFGMTGVQIGIPIIRYPEVAIVGVGAIQKKVIPLEDDVLAIRQMVHISLTFDHRVLDGMYGCGFLGAVQRHLEEDPKLS